jgi:ABC-2 type transport system ATP-binding protein
VPEALRARGIRQRFGDRVVLADVDLDVAPGRNVGHLGPHGAGKTTHMRILLGVIDPDAGTVSLGARTVTADDRLSWGYMPQERGLYQDMRVLDLLVFFARLRGLDKPTGRERAHDLLERLGLGDRGRDRVKELSGGMAQRVQLAAAMVHQPGVLVLDEPFAGLDPVAVGFLSQLIRDHAAAGRHMVFSSHQLDLVEDLCESITLIDRGRVVLEGDLRSLKAASPDRFLRVEVAVDPAWLDGTGAAVASGDASGSRLRLQSTADPAAVLDAVRAHVPVRDFGVETPSLSELFLRAAGHGPDEERHPNGARPAVTGPPASAETRR